MKRNKESKRIKRRTKTEPTLGNSKYARKVRAGNQVYGNGSRCCANTQSRGAK